MDSYNLTDLGEGNNEFCEGVRVAERLALRTLDHEVPGPNPLEGGVQLMTLRRFIALSLSSSPLHRFDMT